MDAILSYLRSLDVVLTVGDHPHTMYPLLLIEVVSLLVEGVLYGVYVVTFSITLHLLLRPRNGKPRRTPLIFVTVMMFCLSTAHLVLFATSLLRHVHDGIIDAAIELPNLKYRELYFQTLVECLNCILGDSIIAWRAWVLWNQKKFALVVPAVLISATTLACAIGFCYAITTHTAPGQTSFWTHSATLWGVVAVGLSFVTNLWAVVLIALRFWTHLKQVSTLLGRQNSTSYRRIIIFLVESGALYCGTLIIFAAMFAAHSNGMYIMSDMLAQLTGIYPTLIVILVCLQLTQRDDMDRLEHAMPITQGARATNPHYYGVSFVRTNEATSDSSSSVIEMQEHRGSRGKSVALA